MTVEVDDKASRARQFEEAIYTMYSHPAVKGILLWGFWDQQLYAPNAALFEGDDITVNYSRHLSFGISMKPVELVTSKLS